MSDGPQPDAVAAPIRFREGLTNPSDMDEILWQHNGKPVDNREIEPRQTQQQRKHTMPPILRNTLAVIAGIVVGSVINMAIITVGPILIPPPEGVDMSDTEKFAENLRLLQPANFIAPWLAHALGTLFGALIAAKVATGHKMKFALGIGGFFLLGGILMVSLVGGPVWFAVLDLIGAYLPMGFLGGMLGGAKKPQPAGFRNGVRNQ